MSECKHKWKYLNTWRKHVCQKCQKPMNVVDFSEYANQLEQERSTALAQVKERELTIEKVEAKCCACHAGHVAQVAVLRGALFHVRDEIDKYGSQANLAWLLESAEEALSATPSEAAERVNALVRALEKLARLGGPGGGYGNSDGNVIAQRALATWRGQEN